MYVISLIHFFKRLNPNVEHWLGFRDGFSGRDTLHVVFIDARLASAWRYSPVRIGTKERQFEKTLTKEQSNDAVSAARLGLSLVLNLATLTRGFAQSLFHLQNGMVWEAKTVSFTWFKGLTYELFSFIDSSGVKVRCSEHLKDSPRVFGWRRLFCLEVSPHQLSYLLYTRWRNICRIGTQKLEADRGNCRKFVTFWFWNQFKTQQLNIKYAKRTRQHANTVGDVASVSGWFRVFPQQIF